MFFLVSLLCFVELLYLNLYFVINNKYFSEMIAFDLD